jgi:bile acid:Na+ symporter, BASS family
MELFKDLATVSVFTLLLCQGLRTSFKDLKFFVGHPGLLLRSLAAALVVVPIAVFFIVIALRPERPVAIGLALLAASPAAPLIVFRMSGVSDRREYATSLHLLIALMSIVTVPVTLVLMARGLNFAAEISSVHVAILAGKLILCPVILGMAVKARFRHLAAKLIVPAEALGKALLLIALVILLFKTHRFLVELSFHSYFSMTLAVTVSLLIGHCMAGAISQGEKSLLALESSGRNPGLVLLMVAVNAPNADAMSVLVPYLVVFLVISTLYLNREKLQLMI